MNAKKLIDFIVKSGYEFDMMTTRELAKEYKKMLMVRKGEVINDKTASERANNMAAALTNTLVTG